MAALRYRFVVLFVICIAPDAMAQSSASTVLREAENLDERLLLDINEWGRKSEGLDAFMVPMTNSLIYTTTVIPVGLYAAGWARDDREMSINGFNVLLGELIAGVTTTIVKETVRRPRPFQTLLGVRIPAGEEHGFSFPSGHSSLSWALSTGLAIAYPEWYVIAPAAIYAATVSISRPYVGVHYPVDVFVGALVGVGSAFLAKELEATTLKHLSSIFPKAQAPIETTPVKILEIKVGI